MNNLIVNIDKLHTTELGVMRIKRNLSLNVDDVVDYCRNKIISPNCEINRSGKNFYAKIDGVIITINVHNYTIITAHKEKL